MRVTIFFVDLVVCSQRSGIFRSDEYIDRRAADQPGIWIRESAAGLDLQRISDRVCRIPVAGRMAGRTLRTAPDPDPGSVVLGRSHIADRAAAFEHRPCHGLADRAAVCFRRRRVGDLSGSEPVCGPLDSDARAWRDQRIDLCRGGSRQRIDASHAELADYAPWLAGRLLVQRGWWALPQPSCGG